VSEVGQRWWSACGSERRWLTAGGSGTDSFDLLHEEFVELIDADVIARRRTSAAEQ